MDSSYASALGLRQTRGGNVARAMNVPCFIVMMSYLNILSSKSALLNCEDGPDRPTSGEDEERLLSMQSKKKVKGNENISRLSLNGRKSFTG